MSRLTNEAGMAAPSRMSRQLTGGNVQEGLTKVESGPEATMSACGEDDSIEGEERPVSVCMIGTGEYTTGYVHGHAADSDKGAGGMDAREYSVQKGRCACSL